MTAKKSPSKKESAHPVNPWPEEWPADAEEKELRLQHLDFAAEAGLYALAVDPTGKLRNRDPELVDMLAPRLRCRSLGDSPDDKECGLFILNRIRDGTPEQVDCMFKTISLMKARAANALKEKNRNAEVILLWSRFRQDHKRRPETLYEFAAYIVQRGHGFYWPSLSAESSWREWGKIWKAVGLSHRAARPGKRKG